MISFALVLMYYLGLYLKAEQERRHGYLKDRPYISAEEAIAIYMALPTGLKVESLHLSHSCKASSFP